MTFNWQMAVDEHERTGTENWSELLIIVLRYLLVDDGSGSEAWKKTE